MRAATPQSARTGCSSFRQRANRPSEATPLQAYAGVSGESLDFPNRAAAEIDLYGGIRPTFGKLALDGASGTTTIRTANASTPQRCAAGAALDFYQTALSSSRT
jgi:hypothetical protein